ncbi:MAG TPA: hypothetical protein VGA74_04395 [Actinomycetota bacterium]|jgi:hypothetical protein
MSLLDPAVNRETGMVSDGEDGGDRPGRAEGLQDEYPRASGLAAMAGVGAVWGFLGYTVLWQGVPFAVNRRFVESVVGTLVLLPVRTVLWGVHIGERFAGRSFDFADENWWIGVAAALTGGAIVVLAFVVVRTAARALRR